MSGICYLILCHENVGQVKEIVEFLSADDAFFVVHVDRKAREDYSCLTGIPRVHVMQERVAVEWGGLSVVDAVIRMSEYAIENVRNVTHYVLLSGSDFPVKLHKKIRDYLSANAKTDYIEGVALPSEMTKWNEGGRRRIEAYAIRLNDHNSATIEPRKISYQNFRQFAKVLLVNAGKLPSAMRIFLCSPKRRFHSGIVPYAGGMWWILSRETLTDTLQWNREHPEYHRYHEDTQIPDELYFNTIVHNAKRCIVNDTKKYVSWKPNCGSSPIWMTYPDDKDIIDDCISNPDIFFVRKIKDSRLIEYIKLEV